MKTVVCLRKLNSDPARTYIGKPGMVHPKTGEAFIDDPYTAYKTSSPCCDSCGEMIGTVRRKYFRRWPPTVDACKCEHCGKGICDRCVTHFGTGKVIGTHKRTTEGGYRYDVPTYGWISLCAECAKVESEKRKQEPQKQSSGDALLTRLGLMP